MAISYTYIGVDGNLVFDFINQIIYCSDTIDSLEIQELVDGSREAEYSETGIGFGKICNAGGKEYLDVDNGVQVGITIVLLDNWVILTEKDTGVFKVLGGNLVQVGGGNPFAENTAITYVNIQSAASTIVSVSSGSGLSTAEHNRLFALPVTTLETDERTAVLSTDTNVQEIKDTQVTVSGVAEEIFNKEMIESYVADGGLPNLQQALFEILAFLEEKNVAGTTMTCKKRDGSSTAMTFTLNDISSPTSITRTT